MTGPDGMPIPGANQPTGLDALIEALTIFRRYGNPARPTHCEHDTLYVLISPDEVGETDMRRLDILGFRPDSTGDAFMSYRFGSA